MKIGKNSTREIALEYARGIGRPLNERMRNEPIHLDNYEEEESINNAYQDQYSYQTPSYENLSQLEANNENFVSELDKIKSMFN